MTTRDDTPILSPAGPAETTTPDPADRVRIRWRDPGASGEYVDGGWWPRSLDLSTELPPLLVEMSAAGYDVHRVTYNRTAWDPAPHRLSVSGRLVQLGGYQTPDAALITLADTAGWRCVDLVVVPPQTDARTAERALALAGLDGDLHHAGEILAEDSIRFRHRSFTPVASAGRRRPKRKPGSVRQRQDGPRRGYGVGSHR